MIPTVSASTGAPKVADFVHAMGVVRVPDFVTGPKLRNLRNDFDFLESFEGPGVKDGNLNAGFGKKITRSQTEGRFPGLDQVFTNAWMREIAEHFFGRKVEPVNPIVYATKELPSTAHVAQDLHFDVIPSLKFFIYLSDTVERNGAFSCIPGTLSFSRVQRARKRQRVAFSEREFTRSHPFPGEWVEPVEGAEGTLIVFTTELWHRAGKVTDGERRVFRGHNHYRKSRLPFSRPGLRAMTTR